MKNEINPARDTDCNINAATFVSAPRVYSGVEWIKTTMNIAKTLSTSTPCILFAFILILSIWTNNKQGNKYCCPV